MRRAEPAERMIAVKKLVALVFMLCLCFVLCSCNSEANQASKNIVASGACDDNINWILYEDGLLMVSGQGDMKDTPWQEYKSQITRIEIQDGVWDVAEYAFANCTAVTSVSVSGHVRGIGNNAFQGCSSLLSFLTIVFCEELGMKHFKVVLPFLQLLYLILIPTFKSATALSRIVPLLLQLLYLNPIPTLKLVTMHSRIVLLLKV